MSRKKQQQPKRSQVLAVRLTEEFEGMMDDMAVDGLTKSAILAGGIRIMRALDDADRRAAAGLAGPIQEGKLITAIQAAMAEYHANDRTVNSAYVDQVLRRIEASKAGAPSDADLRLRPGKPDKQK